MGHYIMPIKPLITAVALTIKLSETPMASVDLTIPFIFDRSALIFTMKLLTVYTQYIMLCHTFITDKGFVAHNLKRVLLIQN